MGAATYCRPRICERSCGWGYTVYAMPSWDILIFLIITAVSVVGGFLQKANDKKNKAARKTAIAQQSKTSRAEKSQAEYKKFRTSVLEKMASKSPVKKTTQVRAGGRSPAAPKVAVSQVSGSGVQASRLQRRPSAKPVKPVKTPAMSSSRAKKLGTLQSPAAAPTAQLPATAPAAISAQSNDDPFAASESRPYVVDQGEIGHRIHSRLSNRQALADAVLLAEILSPPRSLREYGHEDRQ